MSTQQIREQMQKSLEHLRSEFTRMRVGRASSSMVEGVKVEAYGSQMSLKEVAALTTPDARTITIQPWDATVIGDIERGILAANLGLTPINDGKLIRINMPPLTEERRKDFVKQIKKLGEDAKVSVRNARRDALDAAKKQEDLTEDDRRRYQDEIQKLTDSFVKEIEQVVDSKSDELMKL